MVVGLNFYGSHHMDSDRVETRSVIEMECVEPSTVMEQTVIHICLFWQPKNDSFLCPFKKYQKTGSTRNISAVKFSTFFGVRTVRRFRQYPENTTRNYPRFSAGIPALQDKSFKC